MFDRIFRDISKSKPEGEEEDLQDNLEDEAMGEEEVGISEDPHHHLAAIFESTIETSKKRWNTHLEGDVEGHDPFADGSSQRPIGLDTMSREQLGLGEAETEESEAVLERASDDHKQLVYSMLNSAETDIEIWNVLDREVFSLVTQLNLQIKLEDKARKADLRRQKKATKAKAELSETIERRRSTTANRIPTTLPDNESKALTTNVLLSILQTNYALYCLHALRIFRHRNLSSPYALHMLPHLKSLGSISYVLGASTGLYDEILYQKWTQFSDVQGIADLMEEMVNQGIGASNVTLEFLRFIDRARQQDLQGRKGWAKRTWWNLRPVREGWARVKVLYERFKMELEAGAADEPPKTPLVRKKTQNSPLLRKIVDKSMPRRSVLKRQSESGYGRSKLRHWE